MVTKLEKLLISEISGVDEPANELPGFMVAKASSHKGRAIGPDGAWDVEAAEKRIRTATGAVDAPNDAYASCFLWKDSDGETSFGAYKFLVCDEVDGEIKIMPAAIRATAAHKATVPEADHEAFQSAISALEDKVGPAAVPEAEETKNTSIVGKIRSLLSSAGKDEVEMTEEQLNATLDERFETLSKSLVEKLAPKVEETEVSKSEAEHTTTESDATKEEETAAAALTAEDVQKSIEEALKPYNEILEKVLDRLAASEGALTATARKSLDGQDGVSTEGETVEKTPTVADAITKAFRR